MRLTINLDEDLHRMAKALAVAEDCSISAAVNKLLRRIIDARGAAVSGARSQSRKNTKAGLPVVDCKKAVTDEDVYQAEEAEDRRHWMP